MQIQLSLKFLNLHLHESWGFFWDSKREGKLWKIEFAEIYLIFPDLCK